MKLIFDHIEVRLVSLIELGLYEVGPEPTGFDEAEQLRRTFAKSLRVLAACQAATLLLQQQGPYAAESVARMLEDACRGL